MVTGIVVDAAPPERLQGPIPSATVSTCGFTQTVWPKYKERREREQREGADRPSCDCTGTGNLPGASLNLGLGVWR